MSCMMRAVISTAYKSMNAMCLQGLVTLPDHLTSFRTKEQVIKTWADSGAVSVLTAFLQRLTLVAFHDVTLIPTIAHVAVSTHTLSISCQMASTSTWDVSLLLPWLPWQGISNNMHTLVKQALPTDVQISNLGINRASCLGYADTGFSSPRVCRQDPAVQAKIAATQCPLPSICKRGTSCSQVEREDRHM